MEEIIELNVKKAVEIPLNKKIKLWSLSPHNDGCFTSWTSVYSNVVVKEIIEEDTDNTGYVFGVNAFEPEMGKVKLRVEFLKLDWVSSEKLPSVKLF